MLKEARQSRIRSLLDEQGELRVSEIHKALDVSEATVRRDLEELAAQGLVRRTHGGAVPVEPDVEPPLLQRVATNAAEKAAIAATAAGLITPGQTVFLGSGTTVAMMAPHLPPVGDLRIITNSLAVARQLIERDGLEVIVVGGTYRPSEGSMVGALAAEIIGRFHPDTVFLGIRGLHLEQGLTDASLDEATTDRAILAASDHRVVLADHSKFGQVSTFSVAPVTEASLVVTSTLTDPDHRSALASAGTDVVLAGLPTPPGDHNEEYPS